MVQVDSDEQLGELRVLIEAESGKARQVHVTAVMLAPRDAKADDRQGAQSCARQGFWQSTT